MRMIRYSMYQSLTLRPPARQQRKKEQANPLINVSHCSFAAHRRSVSRRGYEGLHGSITRIREYSHKHASNIGIDGY